MESARCTKNNAVYGAQQFAELPVGDLADKRRNLVCPECGRPAFFRKETENERNACFGARPHHEGCSMGAPQANARSHGGTGKYAGLLNSAKRIVIDFDYGQSTQSDLTSPHESDPCANDVGESAERLVLNSSADTHMRLRPLLRLLIDVPQFSVSQQMVEVEGMCIAKACDLFVHAHTITEQHERVFVGVYGKIFSVQYLPEAGTVWLNFGGPKDLSICIPAELAHGLFHRLRINRICAFAKAEVLIFGFVRNSHAGKKFILMGNQEELAVNFARNH